MTQNYPDLSIAELSRLLEDDNIPHNESIKICDAIADKLVECCSKVSTCKSYVDVESTIQEIFPIGDNRYPNQLQVTHLPMKGKVALTTNLYQIYDTSFRGDLKDIVVDTGGKLAPNEIITYNVISFRSVYDCLEVANLFVRKVRASADLKNRIYNREVFRHEVDAESAISPITDELSENREVLDTDSFSITDGRQIKYCQFDEVSNKMIPLDENPVHIFDEDEGDFVTMTSRELDADY